MWPIVPTEMPLGTEPAIPHVILTRKTAVIPTKKTVVIKKTLVIPTNKTVVIKKTFVIPTEGRNLLSLESLQCRLHHSPHFPGCPTLLAFFARGWGF